jgi:hypothetical protein
VSTRERRGFPTTRAKASIETATAVLMATVRTTGSRLSLMTLSSREVVTGREI